MDQRVCGSHTGAMQQGRDGAGRVGCRGHGWGTGRGWRGRGRAGAQGQSRQAQGSGAGPGQSYRCAAVRQGRGRGAGVAGHGQGVAGQGQSRQGQGSHTDALQRGWAIFTPSAFMDRSAAWASFSLTAMARLLSPQPLLALLAQLSCNLTPWHRPHICDRSAAWTSSPLHPWRGS